MGRLSRRASRLVLAPFVMMWEKLPEGGNVCSLAWPSQPAKFSSVNNACRSGALAKVLLAITRCHRI